MSINNFASKAEGQTYFSQTKEEMLRDILNEFHSNEISWEEFLEEVEIVEGMFDE